jgi:hypothetical protein
VSDDVRGKLIDGEIVAYWLALLSCSEMMTTTCFLLARFLKTSKRYLALGWTAPGL